MSGGPTFGNQKKIWNQNHVIWPSFWSNHPEYNFQSKTVKLSYFTLEKSFFFILTNFLFIYLKVAQCCEGSPEKVWTQSLIKNTELDGFPKKIRNKTFYFYTKKKYHLFLFLLSFGPRVHFRGQKLTFWQKKIPPKKQKTWI
jgi:hypothetical protein